MVKRDRRTKGSTVAATLAAVAAAIAMVGCNVAAAAAERRPLSIDDILRMEKIGRVALSPDKRFMVFEHSPPYETAPNISSLYSTTDLSALSRLYLVDLRHPADRRPLFEQTPKAGYWLGAYSPDGARIAVYSMQHGRVTAGVYDVKRDTVRWFAFTPNYFWLQQTPLWVSSDEIVFPVLPDGEQPAILFREGMMARVRRLWSAASAGEQPSSTTIESSADGIKGARKLRTGNLVLVNSASGATRTIADGYFYNLRLSPDGMYLAGLREGGAVQPDPGLPAIEDGAVRRELVVASLGRAHSSASPCPDCDVVLGSLEWAADSSRITFAGREIGKDLSHAKLFSYRPSRGELGEIATSGLILGCDLLFPRPARAVSMGATTAVYAREATVDDDPSGRFASDCKGRYDWFVVNERGHRTNATRSISGKSGQIAGKSADSFFVVTDGEVWRIDATGKSRNLTADIPKSLTLASVGLSSAYFSEEARSTGYLYPTSLSLLRSDSELVTLDVKSSRLHLSPAPPDGAEILGMTDDGEIVVLRSELQGSTAVSIWNRRASTAEVIRINSHLNQIEPAAQLQLQVPYGGKILTSCALLPPHWKPDERYPLLVEVYPNYGGACRGGVARFNPDSHELLAAHGYVLLSVALPMSSVSAWRTAEMARTVLASVDEAIRQGIADPSRLAISGTSQGQHSVLQVLTETNRFRAAIVSHGIANFTSQYGAMPLYVRLVPDSFSVGNAARFENPFSENWLGTTPWADPGAYVDASPVFRADRIQTPLLIFHSDFDQFPLDQSAEIFAAMYRLRKEARYVVYWGEGHGLLSPANVRDRWKQIFGWLDEHLRQ